MFRTLMVTAAILAFSQASVAQSLRPDSARTKVVTGPSEPAAPLDVKPSVSGGPQKLVYRVSGLRDTTARSHPI
jgi:hypothetical protein